MKTYYLSLIETKRATEEIKWNDLMKIKKKEWKKETRRFHITLQRTSESIWEQRSRIQWFDGFDGLRS